MNSLNTVHTNTTSTNEKGASHGNVEKARENTSNIARWGHGLAVREQLWKLCLMSLERV